jgi:hypothetical protein
MFIVTSSGNNLANSNDNSSLCALVSPRPIIPPVHNSNPASLAIPNVFSLSSYVWVVQISENFDFAVSKLWLYLFTCNSFSFSACCWVRKPKLHSMLIPTLSLTSLIILQTSSKSF